ncbi:hypothetical protein [Micromonospora purpureochromogenes]|uniref:hypothetical protein n=1 Tax=Micromonospora purpureochromogenes TaxID=47872 RepID=UPI0015C845FD|nr:hypothetical protein [Micromonospora purpureochromogenes]
MDTNVTILRRGCQVSTDFAARSAKGARNNRCGAMLPWSSVIPLGGGAGPPWIERQLVVAPVAEHHRTEQVGHRNPVRGVRVVGERYQERRHVTARPPSRALVVDVAEQLGQRTAPDRHLRRARRSQLVRYVDGRPIRVVQRLPRDVVEPGQRVGQLIRPAVLPQRQGAL